MQVSIGLCIFAFLIRFAIYLSVSLIAGSTVAAYQLVVLVELNFKVMVICSISTKYNFSMDGQAGSYLGSSTVISGSSAQSDVFEATDHSRVRPVSSSRGWLAHADIHWTLVLRMLWHLEAQSVIRFLTSTAIRLPF